MAKTTNEFRRRLHSREATTVIRFLVILTALLLAPLTAARADGASPRRNAAAETSPQKKTDPSLDPINDDPALPRVLLIGDSISMGYTLPVRTALKGKANVHRPQLRRR
jgi:hypothetical protein